MIRWIAGIIAGLALAACDATPTKAGAPQPTASINQSGNQSGKQSGNQSDSGATSGAGFDYWLLALSWSPTYCSEADNAARDPQQCRARRPFAFVTHGLWPQRETGYPEFCDTAQSRVATDIADTMMDIMPSRGLIQHQWRKHGACAGLSQKAYFDLVRETVGKIVIPPAYRALTAPLRVSGREVEAAFLATNPGLRADSVTVQCRGGRLREVRICLDRQGAFRACGKDVREACERPATMPPVR